MTLRRALVGFWAGSILTMLSTAAPAYDLRTHGRLSQEAAGLAGLVLPLMIHSDLPADAKLPGRWLTFRLGRLTPNEWIAQGGRDEDSPASRVLNHFYDPVHDVGLTIPILGGAKAPDWALEGGGPLDGQNHSYRDAREAFYTGLALPDRANRQRELGHMFYALGHVIHLIQDMAVPEHTRDDAHVPLGAWGSLMEKYVDRNILAFPLTGAAIPSVTRVRDLWVTADRSGRGLAEFSNAHFVSPDTNFTELRDGATAERFPRPELRLADFNSSATTCKDGAPAPGGDRAPLTFYANTLADPLTGDPLRNDRMTTYSIFDQDLQARGFRLVFALNCFNIDAAADLLLPRAVAYSAALLRHFFRGELRAVATYRVVGFYNLTPDEPMDGTFEIYSEAEDGTRRRLASSNLAVGANGGSAVVSVAEPLPWWDITTDCWVVFRGRLGNEADAVVAGNMQGCPTAEPPPPPPCPISVCWD